MLSENINLNFWRHNFLHNKEMNQCSGSLSLILCFYFTSLPLMKDTKKQCQLIQSFAHGCKSAWKIVKYNKLFNCSLRQRKQCPWVLPWLRNFLGYVLIFAMCWFRFILLYHQVPFHGVGTPHRQGLNSVILLVWEVGQKSPPTAAMRSSLLVLP